MKTNCNHALFLAVVSVGFFCGSSFGAVGAEPGDHAAHAAAAYPLSTCIVSGEKLGEMGEPVVSQHESREIKLCCKSCAPKFKADPAGYLKKLDEAIVAQQKAAYPTDVCVVDDAKLGSMGEPVDAVAGNRLVRLSCKACLPKLHADHTKYIAALDKLVVEKEKPHYPLDTCVVSGKKLGEDGEPVDHIFAGWLVRFCCAKCVTDFAKDPWAYMERLEAAHKAHAKP